MDESTLADVLRRAQRREPDALTRLVDAYAPRVFGLLYRLTGRRDVAEDLVQETFLRMVRNIEKYEHTGRFEPWLFRIAANLARDQARARVRRGNEAPLDDDWTTGNPLAGGIPANPVEQPDNRLLRREQQAALEAGLRRLSPTEREILMLRFMGELSFRQIAEILKIPLGTALARAHRALKRLRGELTDEDAK